MGKVTIRYQRVTDAARFFAILNNPNFTFFDVCPKDVAAEKKFIQDQIKKRKEKKNFDYAILYDGKLVGGCGIGIDQKRDFICEIGYFVDEAYWGKGIASKAVKLLEKVAFTTLKLKRVEIVMDIKHKASWKVAEKCGYKREGKMKKSIRNSGKFATAYLYAKVR